MEDPLAKYLALFNKSDLSGLSDSDALEHIGSLTDLSLDLNKAEGVRKAISLSDELLKRNLSDLDKATCYYFVANAWDILIRLSVTAGQSKWEWEQPEIEKSILNYRRALQAAKLPKGRRCQILTNLGNGLSHVGRFVESVEYWDKALILAPSFGMARGNRGCGLSNYAKMLYDKSDTVLFLKMAHDDITESLSSSHLDPGAGEHFCTQRKWIESILRPGFSKYDVSRYRCSLGKSKAERLYRKWCLENRLFLNPLNDLGSHPIAACDRLMLPGIVTDLDEGPGLPGFFNQMKQEFVSARHLLYEGISSEGVHYSDRGVKLVNTLDYPEYSLAAEKVKSAYSKTYSLFDKIAFFLNHYLRLGIPERDVSFRSLWFGNKNKGKPITMRLELRGKKNWPLRGLFWLAKDLSEKAPDFIEAMEPDAKQLVDVRNNLEHKYLKLHGRTWAGPERAKDTIFRSLSDTLSYSLYRDEFEAKALRLQKTSRAAIIYLALAVHVEERERASLRDPKKPILPMPMDRWEDDWKRGEGF